MPRQSPAQRSTMERVMHEFKHGELASSTGRKVKNRQRAIAIGLSESGASREQSLAEKKRALRRTERRETKRETTRDIDGGSGPTKAELYDRAKRRHIAGRSKMNKRQLERALGIG